MYYLLQDRVQTDTTQGTQVLTGVTSKTVMDLHMNLTCLNPQPSWVVTKEPVILSSVVSPIPFTLRGFVGN